MVSHRFHLFYYISHSQIAEIIRPCPFRMLLRPANIWTASAVAMGMKNLVFLHKGHDLGFFKSCVVIEGHTHVVEQHVSVCDSFGSTVTKDRGAGQGWNLDYISNSEN